MLCDDLERCGVGREAPERGDICIIMADSIVVWQKPTHYIN